MISVDSFYIYHHADINVDNICGKFDSCDKDVTYVQNTKSFFLITNGYFYTHYLINRQITNLEVVPDTDLG